MLALNEYLIHFQFSLQVVVKKVVVRKVVSSGEKAGEKSEEIESNEAKVKPLEVSVGNKVSPVSPIKPSVAPKASVSPEPASVKEFAKKGGLSALLSAGPNKAAHMSSISAAAHANSSKDDDPVTIFFSFFRSVPNFIKIFTFYHLYIYSFYAQRKDSDRANSTLPELHYDEAQHQQSIVV